ncbi:MAG: MFS transporter [Candidatus Hodarchaeales archaeon]
MSDKKSNAWFTGNVLLLGLVSFFADVSGEMMTPVLPLLIAELGGANVIIGLIGGLGDAVANIVKVFSGYISDKTGRRKLLITVGYGVPFFAKFGIGLSYTWQQILILKPTERLGKGIRGAPRDSLLADSIPFELRGKAFGFHRMMDTAGAILGSILSLLIVFFLFEKLNSNLITLQIIIIISAFISLLALIPIFLLKDPHENKFGSNENSASLIQNLKSLPSSYYKFLIISTIFGLANFTILIFIIHTKTVVLGIDINTPGIIQTSVPILLFIWFNITYTALSIPFGSISDRYSRKQVFSLGLVLYIITSLGMAVTKDLLLLLLVFGLYGAFNAATDGIQKAFIVDLVPGNLKGTGIGLLQTVMGLASIAGGLIAGLLYDINPSNAFIYGGIVASISLILLIFWKITPYKS